MLQLSRATPATVDVLRVLAAADEAMWGLQVIQATSRGPGTVYPILERLEQSGWLESQWESTTERRGPRRRLYRLSPEGSISVGHVLAPAAPRGRRAAPKSAPA